MHGNRSGQLLVFPKNVPILENPETNQKFLCVSITFNVMISQLTARMLDTVGLDIGSNMEICMTYLVTSIPQMPFL